MRYKYFKILGIQPTSSSEEIKRAYIRQLFLWHPDRAKSTGITNEKEANIQTSNIIEAYNFLKENINPTENSRKGPVNTNTYGDPIFRKKVSDFKDTGNINWNVRKNIISSNIDWTEYHPDSKILIIKFKKSGAYLYKNVPPNIVSGLETAQSKGKYFNQNILRSFNYHNLDSYSEWHNYID